MIPKQFGFEVELDLSPLKIREFLDGWNVVIHDDGSIRKPHFVYHGHPVVIPKRITVPTYCLTSTDAFGTEVVTPPLSLQSARAFCKQVASIFASVPRHPTSSIHIHADVIGWPWRAIWKVVMLAYVLEAPIFRIACGGDEHRGETNEYLYARPMSMPIGVYLNDELVPLIDWDEFPLTTASTASEFVDRWGCLGQARIEHNRHYMPHRLMFVNLQSVLEQGTLEFRVFDGRYALALSFLELVVALFRAAARYSVDEIKELVAHAATMAALAANGAGKMPDIGWVASILKLPSSSAVRWLDAAWGKRYPKPPKSLFIVSHYDERRIRSTTSQSDYRHRNNVGMRDTGKEDFSLFVKEE